MPLGVVHIPVLHSMNGQANPGPMFRTSDVHDLFSYQLQRLTELSSRGATIAIPPGSIITMAEWRALAVLDHLGEATLQGLADRSWVRKSHMSRIVAGVIDRGLIQRTPNPEDGRSVLLRLTPEGQCLTREILAIFSEHDNRLLTGLSIKERQQLIELICRVLDTSSTYDSECTKAPPVRGRLQQAAGGLNRQAAPRRKPNHPATISSC